MWSHVKKIKKYQLLIFSYLLSIAVAFIVYINGGTNTAYPYFMNIPIILATFTNGKIRGFIHAIISGLLLGPYMPLFVDSNTMQKPLNWVIRLIFFLLMSLVIGFLSDYSKKEYEIKNSITKEISDSHMATIYALVKLSESRDDETGTHIERVSILCKLLTEKLLYLSKYAEYIDNHFIDNIFKASALHDIGKVGIPDNILLKPGKLTAEEFEVIKQHTIIGANTLLDVQKKYPNNKFLDFGIVISYYHHEKWNGKGYPCGLSKEAIPLPARIMALVDVYDALRSKRVYKEAYSHEESVEIIKEGRGTHFDPEIVDVFLENEKEFKDAFERISMNLEV
ncbi:HD-GYP domain-containing protein [Defluviitalea saccharophila]|uniref:HD domain-containing protein n=1 Tax=Defluviitalea saccharophila TaxID=879970 RepID=A0ABZ2Y349_9FIRM